MIFGIILVLMMIFRPQGILPGGVGARASSRGQPGPRRDAPAPCMALFEARGITKRFGGLTALNQVDFALEAGDRVDHRAQRRRQDHALQRLHRALRARRGQRRRSAARSLVGLRPDQITALGVCRTFQNIRLFKNMTAIENVLVGMHSRIPLGLWDVLCTSPALPRTSKSGLGQRGPSLLERVGSAASANDRRAQPSLRRSAAARDRARPRLPRRACCCSTSPRPE